VTGAKGSADCWIAGPWPIAGTRLIQGLAGMPARSAEQAAPLTNVLELLLNASLPSGIRTP
jgi:hypothetical protein